MFLEQGAKHFSQCSLGNSIKMSVEALKALENLLKCDNCGDLSNDDVMFVATICRHELCTWCFDRDNWRGTCPVPGCKQPTNRKEVCIDHTMGKRSQYVKELRSMLGLDIEPMMVEPTAFFDDDKDVDLSDVAVARGYGLTEKKGSNSPKRVLSEIGDSQNMKETVQKVTRKGRTGGKKSKLTKEPTQISINSFFTNEPNQENVLPKTVEHTTRGRGRARKPMVHREDSIEIDFEDNQRESSDKSDQTVKSDGLQTRPLGKRNSAKETNKGAQKPVFSREESEEMDFGTPPAKETSLDQLLSEESSSKPQLKTVEKQESEGSITTQLLKETDLFLQEDLPVKQIELPKSDVKKSARNVPKGKSIKGKAAPKKKPMQSKETSLDNSTASSSKAQTKGVSKLNKRNKKGETQLHSACCKRDFKTVLKLLEQGAETNTQDNNGWTPLHEVAPYANCLNIVEILLSKGANPNVPGGDHNTTPLHEAAAVGCSEICKKLIEKGASKTARDSFGRMPYDSAIDDETRKVIDETLCDMTDSEQLETTVLLNTSRVPERFEFYAHDLNKAQMDLIQDLKISKNQLDFDLSTSLSDDVTHVIVNLSEDLRSCASDIVYYQALVTGKWIVDFSWLEESAKSEGFVTESDYVAEGCHDCRTGGPMLAKNNFLNRLPKLFDGCHIYLQGVFEKPYPSKSELSNLLKNAGAVILRRTPDPELIPLSEQKVPYHAKPSSSLIKCSHYIIYQEGKKEPLLKYDMSHFKTLPAAWLLECIKNFGLVEPFK